MSVETLAKAVVKLSDHDLIKLSETLAKMDQSTSSALAYALLEEIAEEVARKKG